MKVFFAALISLIQIMPIVVVVVNSFRGNDEISKLMLGFPTKFHFENYAVAWTRGGYAYAYASSLIIGFGTAFSVVLLVGLAVYGLYKTDCFFKEFFKSYFVAGLAIPTFAVIVPLFFFFYKINLINTHNVGVMLDTFHMNIEEDNIAAAIRKAGDRLYHFHIGEGNRKVPGKGMLPWNEIGQALRDINYQHAAVMEPFVMQGGTVGHDIKIWRDIIGNCSEVTLDMDAQSALHFVKHVFEV